MANKLVVYTAIFGNYDRLIDPPEKFEGCDFVCFTDNENLVSEIWSVFCVKPFLPPNMMNRIYKILPHRYLEEYEFSLYIDGNIEVKSNPSALLDKYMSRFNMVIPRHYERHCIFDEAETCLKAGKGDKEKILLQIKKYRQEGYPERRGLVENNILLRRHNVKVVITAMESWWRELNIFSARDQISFCYVAWKNGFEYGLLEESSRIRNPYFRLKEHKVDEEKPFLKRAAGKIAQNKHRNRGLFFAAEMIERLSKLQKKLFQKMIRCD